MIMLQVENNNEKEDEQKTKCVSSYDTDGRKGEHKMNRNVKDLIKKMRAVRSKITVEPFVVCYVLPSVLAGLAVQNLCLEKACLVNLKYDNDTCHHIMAGDTRNYAEEERQVQTYVASMTAWSYPLQTALPGMLILFIGAWSDRTHNRKAFMVLPILGKLLSIVGIMLSTHFFMELALDETALLEGLPPALTGGRVAMTMAVYSYISDITSEEERTFRLGIITAILTLSRPIGLSLSGVMTKKFGYYGVFSIATVFYVLGFVYILLRLKERTKEKAVESNEPASVLEFISVKDFVTTVNVAFKRRAGSNRLQILLILCAYMLIVGPVLGEAQMTYWFTRYKFKFTEVDYSLFLTYSVLINFVGSFITIYLFSKRWKMDDNIIGAIAGISRISASIVYALAPSRVVYFIGPLLDMFSSAGATALRSLITKLVENDEIGKASSLIGISEALVPVIYSPVYSKVYLATLSNFAGAFYLISAALAVPAIIIFITVFVLQRRPSDTSKQAKDITQREIEITRC